MVRENSRGTADISRIACFVLNIRSCKLKVKCTLLQALRLCTGRTAHSGSRGIALLFHGHGARRG